MSTPTLLNVVTYPDPVQGRYIVLLKDGVQWHDYPYDDVVVWDLVLNGFCATLSIADLDVIRTSPDVQAIYEDGYAQISTVGDSVPLSVEEIDALGSSLDADDTLETGQELDETYIALSQEELKEFSPVDSKLEGGTNGAQTNAPWGLQRIIQRGKLSNQNDRKLRFNYNWDDPAGSGVDAYVIGKSYWFERSLPFSWTTDNSANLGIFISHRQFGQRARWGATFGGYPNRDDNGHGSHCAGTIGSSQFGVAKMVSLIAVKVLGRDGKGRWSDIISGLDWVARSAANTGRPSIASMSLGGPPYRAVDQAVEYLTRRGVHVVVSAGNNNTDAIDQSPARVASAITVGAANIRDARSPSSNFGSVLDVFAPGENVISTSNRRRGFQIMSGTSMACPHVSGTLALLISISGNGTPAALQARLKTMAVENALANIPSNTPNLLLQVK